MNDDTLMLRQVHPRFFHEGQLSSQAFKLFPSDREDKGLSVDDGDMISAENSHEFYTKTRKRESACVFAITVAQAKDLQVPAKADPLVDASWHCLLDHSALMELSDSQLSKIAKKMKLAAEQNGCQYQPN